MNTNRRKHKRFAATAFLNMPVLLTPLHPFFGQPIKGKLIDLSAGGIAILINVLIPAGTHLDLTVTFPDGTQLKTITEVKYTLPKGNKYMHGIEFLILEPAMVQKIETMSSDYIDCESRVQQKKLEVCTAKCSFFSMCTKPERREPRLELPAGLELSFKPSAK